MPSIQPAGTGSKTSSKYCIRRGTDWLARLSGCLGPLAIRRALESPSATGTILPALPRLELLSADHRVYFLLAGFNQHSPRGVRRDHQLDRRGLIKRSPGRRGKRWLRAGGQAPAGRPVGRGASRCAGQFHLPGLHLPGTPFAWDSICLGRPPEAIARLNRAGLRVTIKSHQRGVPPARCQTGRPARPRAGRINSAQHSSAGDRPPAPPRPRSPSECISFPSRCRFPNRSRNIPAGDR